MTQIAAPRRRTARTGLALIAVAALAALLLAVPAWRGSDAAEARPAPGLAAPVDAAGLVREAHVVIPAVLERIYEAFAATGEAEIYDGLAGVAAGDALEALYLERAGALASGGLPDQVVHEIRVLSGTWAEDGDAMRADIRWTVIGEVGHDAHTHMRGNAYGAVLRLEPEDGAWRLTGFDLTDVDRTGAGDLVTARSGDGAPAAE